MSLYNRLKKRLSKGEMVKCSVSNKWFRMADTNPDGNGGRVLKCYDVFDKTVKY